MRFYRVKQFMWSITSNFKTINEEYLDQYLDENEKQLFLKLNKSDIQHCIRVCSDCIKHIEENKLNIDKKKVAKAALLHDIGKIKSDLNIITKSIVVLADKATSSKIKKYNNIKIIDEYYNHPKKGEKLLKSVLKERDKDILQTVRKHHKDEDESDNDILKIVRYYDNKN